MPVKTGRLAEFRKALGRIDSSVERELADTQQQLESTRNLPPELAKELRDMETDELLDVLRGQDPEVALNREVFGYVRDLLKHRLDTDEELTEEDMAPAPAVEGEQEEEQEEFFVGWSAGQSGEIQFINQIYQPSNRAHISHETLTRYRQRVLAGGVLGKVGDRAAMARAIELQRQNDQWRGRTLHRVGEIQAPEIYAALKAVASSHLKNLLKAQGTEPVTLALDGRRAVLLTKDGQVTRLGRVETRHLALVGLLPRHWFLPLMWWQRMMLEEEAELAERGRSKKRIYKGKYDDEDLERKEEEKE